MNTLIEYYVGIDNSVSGAIAILDADGNIIDTSLMPLSSKEEVHYGMILDMMSKNGCDFSNTLVMLEEPHKFAKGINAVRIMWRSFERIAVAVEMSGYVLSRILSNQWQTQMLQVFGDKKSKEWAEARVKELWDYEVLKKQYKTKAKLSGVNDALLIAEYLRRKHLGLTLPDGRA